MKNRISTQSNPGKLVGPTGEAVSSEKPKIGSISSNKVDQLIAAAKDGDMIQLRVTTRRQASTKDCFRIARKGFLDETAEGWTGLAKYFGNLEIADTVCYLTYIRQMIYPDEPGKWFAPVLDAIVYRCPDKGGQTVELSNVPLLPPLPGHAEEIPQPHRPAQSAEELVQVLEEVLK